MNPDETIIIKNELNELVEKYGINNISTVLDAAKFSQKTVNSKK